jgi:2,3-bisphosphoglycerate-independent phosphoglycerate mutase
MLYLVQNNFYNEQKVITYDFWRLKPSGKISAAIDNAHVPFIDSSIRIIRAQLRTILNGITKWTNVNSEVGQNLVLAELYQDLAKPILLLPMILVQKRISRCLPTLVITQKCTFRTLFLMVEYILIHHLGINWCYQQHGLQKFCSRFNDGRDVDPKIGKHYIQDLQDYIADTS